MNNVEVNQFMKNNKKLWFGDTKNLLLQNGIQYFMLMRWTY